MAKKTNIKKKANKVANTVADKATGIAKKAGENPIVTAQVLGGIALLVVGYIVIKRLSKGVGNVFDGDPNIEDQIDLDIQIPTGTQPTISNATANNYASQLLDAFNAKEPFWGTDEDTVEAVFDKLKNAADFKLVSQAFGLKDYNGYNSPPTGIFSNLDSYELRNLVYWLKEEIKPNDGNVFNKVKSRVESAGLIF